MNTRQFISVENQAISSAAFLILVERIILARCASTVRRDRFSSSAISSLVLPCAIIVNICRCRPVSGSSASASHDTAIWTAQAGQEISHIELHMRSTLSHELVEQIRYRTWEGMKTVARKGKATTRLCYGYRLGQQRDANGDRIRACARSNLPRQRLCAGSSSNMPTGSARPQLRRA